MNACSVNANVAAVAAPAATGFRVLRRQQLNPDVTRLDVSASRIAEVRRPGQFVIVHQRPGSERIPLTIADSDPAAGSIALVIQAVGRTTRELVAAQPGEALLDVCGPLGHPTEMISSGRALCVGGGVGTAVVHPIAQGLRRKGVDVISVIGGRSKPWVIFEEELRQLGEVIVCTDDGSHGRHGFVTEAVRDLLTAGGIDIVYAVGPVPMMRAVSELTRPFQVRTIVSLNPVMVDGTGMCGGCRVSVGGETRFACVDGPEFDGHAVDFELLADRLRTYREFEQRVAAPHDGPCRVGLGVPEPAAAETRMQIPATPITTKQRLQIPRQEMIAQGATERAANFGEVNLGFSEQLALLEAQRCLQCRDPRCVAGCPVQVNIPQFIRLVERGDLAGAAQSLLCDNALPAVTGRVCPQETQCEAECVRGAKGDPVAIGHLERFVADWAFRHNGAAAPKSAPTGRKVAVVGGGPAGLTAARELAQQGHDVTIYEALHQPGGVLVYGIPEFRLPKRIVSDEVERLVRAGVKIECNVVIGRTYTVPELRERFDAIFIANGAGLPVFMNVPGENAKGVYSANEYLTRVNLMEAFKAAEATTPVLIGRNVVTIGGGNVAMDSARTAKRIGGETSTIVYRRTRAEMPARAEEIHHAEEEGIRFEFLVAPLEVLRDDKNWVRGLKCIRMTLGEPDASGRRRPVPVEGSEFELPCDVLVVAIGTRANPLLTATCPELSLDRRGNIIVDERGMTNLPGVFAGGDIARGAATVILAMGDGKRAASAIHTYLQTR